MKLIKFGPAGQEKPGVIINDKKYDVSHLVNDYDKTFFGGEAIEQLKRDIENVSLKELAEDIRLGAPLASPSKIICVGLNYIDHAKETNSPIPQEPVLFFKASSAMMGPNDNLVIPKNSKKTDWEVELAIVIGKKASYVSKEEALHHVAGYVLHNDYSEREFQLERGGQWVKGKSCDTFAPIGPFIATPDEIKDINNVRLWLKVNDKIVQDSNTKNMIFDIPYIISYISHFMTLIPGDIISTGTPPGVGLGMKPDPWYLKAGDIVELGIDGLGSSTQHVKAYE